MIDVVDVQARNVCADTSPSDHSKTSSQVGLHVFTLVISLCVYMYNILLRMPILLVLWMLKIYWILYCWKIVGFQPM